MSSGHILRASQSAMPVFTPARFASSVFERIMPCRRSASPPTAIGLPLNCGANSSSMFA